jgi:hypothetical protein
MKESGREWKRVEESDAMFVKTISNRLDAIISPARNELRLAQEQALERIQQVISKAENEVALKGRFMSVEQRFQQAIKELENAEEQLLSALGSMVKALGYIAPEANPFFDIPRIKDIKGSVIDPDQQEPSRPKRGLLGRIRS